MKARLVSFARGARWLGEGWRLFRVAPLAWLAIVFAYWLSMTLLSLVPLVGIAAAMVLVPGLSVGFMSASRRCEQGEAPEISQLFDGFRERPRSQVALGLAYVVTVALVLAATAIADGGALAGWMVYGRAPDAEALDPQAFLLAFAVATLLYLPVMMAFWFAPLLVAWHALGAAQALFYSFFACLVNWRAFLGYGIATGALTLAVPVIVLTALMLVAGGEVHPGGMTLAFPLLMLLLPVLFASFYASYRDIFGAAQGDAP